MYEQRTPSCSLLRDEHYVNWLQTCWLTLVSKETSFIYPRSLHSSLTMEDNNPSVVICTVLLCNVIWLGITTFIISISLASRLPNSGLYCSFGVITFGSLVSSTFRTGQIIVDYNLGAALGSCIFNAFHLLVLVDPLKQYRHKLDDPKEGPNRLPWLERVHWAFCVCISVRGIGWNYEARLRDQYWVVV